MPRSQASRRGRLLASLALIAAALYLSLSVQRVREGKGSAVLDLPLLPVSPRILAPGWHLIPRGIARITYYPEAATRVAFRFPSRELRRLVSSEGVGVDLQGSLAYRVPAAGLLALHARAKGDPEARVVAPLLRRDVLKTVREASFARISGSHRFELEAELSRRLGPDLRKQGIVFMGLRVDAVRMAGGSLAGISLAPIPGSRLLLVGLDGADWRVIDPLLARGRLPNLARLIAGGVRARLKTVEPILSPVVWTTAATGFLPSRHGILDFMVKDTRTGKQVPITSRQRKVKAIWNLLDEAGVPVGIIGWWATWPAEPVDGYIVSDRVAYQLMGQGRLGQGTAREKTFPPGLFDKISPLIVPPESITDADLSPFLRLPDGVALRRSAESRVDEFRTVLASTRTYEGIAQALASGGYQRFEAVYFEGIDTTSHLFMPFRPPRRPGISASDFALFSGSVDAFYVYQDQVLGEILEKASPDTNILVISDHGFRSAGDRPAGDSRIEYATAALWHRRFGILIASGPAFKKGVLLSEESIVDVTPTILALFGLPVGEDMQGRPMVDLFRPTFLRAHPVRYRPSWETGRSAEAPPIDDPVGDRALKEKLISLGYLSQEGTLSRNNLGNSLLAQGDLKGAIREFHRAVEEAPDFVLPKINLARAYLSFGDLESARKWLAGTLGKSDEFPQAQILMAEVERREGKASEAESRLRKLLARGPSAAAHKSLGLLYQQKGKLDLAASEFRKAAEIDPEDPEGYNNLGVVLKEEGRPEEAEIQFRKAIDADPDFAGSYNNLALIAMDRHDWSAAGPLLEEALKRSPGDPKVHNNRGNLLVHQGDLEGAGKEFRKALDLDGGYAEPHNGLASILRKRGDRQGEMEEYRRALKIDPAYMDARLNLAQALMQAGEPREAARWCREGTRLHPERTELWNLLGEALVRAGDPAAAREAFRSSLQRDPSQKEIRRKLGTLAGGLP